MEDPYKVPLEKVLRTADPEGHKNAGHDMPFKPAKVVRDKPYKAPYEHMKDRVDIKKNYRDADGNVIVEDKNFYTSPAKKGRVGKQTFFTPHPAHLPDDYNYPKTLALKEMKEAKKLEQEKPFSQKAKQIGVFASDKAIYGEDVPIPARKPKPEMKPPMEQEVAFKPAKPARSGVSAGFEKFPKYMENPLKFTERKVKVEGEESPSPFKKATNFRSRPSPSVVCNVRNIKASFPSIFRK